MSLACAEGDFIVLFVGVFFSFAVPNKGICQFGCICTCSENIKLQNKSEINSIFVEASFN
jgi:hypothetical protein